ncbi:MAG: sulfatase-like hydrolase/transferase [Saccharofermentanales bacterium]|nr:sulfatase-like hydrolase/transferase [Clostridiaceae bacterium]
MNYVLFYPDELRAESMSVYGHPLIKTPNYERLAREGTVFEHNYSTHPVCAASRCSLVTGWYPHVKGYRTLRYELDNSQPNFFKYLREAGYKTCLSAKNHCFDRTATEAGFDRVIEFTRTSDMWQDVIQEKGQADYTMVHPPVPADQVETIPDHKFVEAGMQFIRDMAAEKSPFFMFFSINYPHCPYTGPEEFYNMYDPDDIPPLRDLSWLEGKPKLYRLIRQYRESGRPEDWIYKKMNAIYLGMISYTDMLLGRVIATLEQEGLYEDTTVIVCSDHGDFAGDVGLPEKWPSAMDDMLTRVPLIIRRPGCPGGHRVRELTQSFDIFPTVLDYENIAIRHDQFGVSLRHQVEGAPGDPDRVVYCEGGYDTREPHCFEGTDVFPYTILNRPGTDYYPKMQQQQKEPDSVCRVIMQRDSRYKLTMRTNGENEFYDMLEDPREYYNLYNDPIYSRLINERTRRMLTWLIHTSDVVPWEGHV